MPLLVHEMAMYRVGSCTIALNGLRALRNITKRSCSIVSQKQNDIEKLFPKREEFQSRHIGPREQDQTEMLDSLGFKTLDEMTDRAVPDNIRLKRDLNINEPIGKPLVIPVKIFSLP
ncbi:hypothetical protein J437_LFUL013747 [Ladona fulva]|uniref:Glycine cleavage system P-protein N-terminal domain-containing protein n=1 Tax=Ladona fulva TaxID=123851 RepID=A0A8K0KE29_LADFU|nr:hypothetical protein J437_LFUL013747 [Ladona fulva]